MSRWCGAGSKRLGRLEQTVAYSGRIDDSRTGTAIGRHDLRDAIAAIVAGRPVAVAKTEPFGCAIIWWAARPGRLATWGRAGAPRPVP